MLKMTHLVLAAICVASSSCTSMKSATSASAPERGQNHQPALGLHSKFQRGSGAVASSSLKTARIHTTRADRSVSPEPVPQATSAPKKSFLGLAVSFSGGGLSITRATPAPSRHWAPFARSSSPAVAVQTVRTTAYTHSESDHLTYGKKSAAGGNLKYGNVRSAAADWSVYPVGTTFQIEGDSTVYEIDDYGSALVGTGTIDIYKPTKASMNDWGVRNVKINVLKWGSFDKSLAIMRPRSKYPHIRQMVQKIERVAPRSI